MTFSTYSDESGVFGHRYQSIALISGQDGELTKLRDILQGIIRDRNLVELKFTEISGYQSPRAIAARKFIKSSIKDFARYKKIRIDVLTWDTQDPRHNVPNRDDIANLEEMYYKVLKHMAIKWNQARWNFYPDKNSKINWQGIKSYLNITRLRRSKYKQHTLLNLLESEQVIQFTDITQLDSFSEPLIQLADFFAGIARFTGEEGVQCVKWLASYGNRKQLRMRQLLLNSHKEQTARRKGCRFQLVGELNQICKNCRMGVSLNKNKRLWTPDSNNPINFWNYVPQGEYDKAPSKKK